MAKTLTPRQRRFVECYAASGNATQAAKQAGYADRYADRFAKQLLENSLVANYLAELNQKLSKPAIATAEERQRFWTRLMRRRNIEYKDRLKASELLGKAQGDFIERREVSGDLTVRVEYGDAA
ncbi:MAG: terminase small subunit [Gammaproteobacteria bacterium]